MAVRFLIMGAGGLGGIIAAHLIESGQNVEVFSTNSQISTVVNQRGFSLIGDFTPNRTIPGRVVSKIPDGTFDFIIIATQPPQLEEAVLQSQNMLAPAGAVVVLQNGLCEARVAKLVGADRVLGAVVTWGASMPEPGVYEQTSAGGFSLGHPEGKEDPRLQVLAAALSVVGPCDITTNLLGVRWAKLAINCTVSSLGAIGGDRLGVLMQLRLVRRLALEIMTEVVEVSRKEGVKLEKVYGAMDLDWVVLSPEERRLSGSPGLLAKHSLLLGVGFRYRRLRSSMLSALERGRPPAVDFLNGEIVTRGQKYVVATPVNQIIQETVWAISRNEAHSGVPLLEKIFAETQYQRGPTSPG